MFSLYLATRPLQSDDKNDVLSSLESISPGRRPADRLSIYPLEMERLDTPLVFVQHEPSLSCSSTLTTYIQTMTRQWPTLAFVVLPLILNALAITRYIPEGQETLFGLQPSSTDSSLTASYTGSAAYDPRTLIPPLPPTDPPVNTQFAIQLTSGDTPGLSIRHHGAFLGFSIEFSVSNHVRKCSPTLANKGFCSPAINPSGPQQVWLPRNLWSLTRIANPPLFSARRYLFRS